MNLKIRELFLMSSMILLVSAPVLGQSSKTIEEKKIATRTVYEYFIEEGLDEPVVESIERYNETGDLIEIQEFNNKGDVKRWEKYTYNEEGKVEDQLFLDAKGRVEKRESNLYKDGLRVERQFYNNKNKMYKRKVYEYEYRK